MQSLKPLLSLAILPLIANAQPANVVRDGFGDAATAWLKKHPDVAKCADHKVVESQKQQQKQGLDPATPSDVYGEFIQACYKAKASKEKSLKK